MVWSMKSVVKATRDEKSVNDHDSAMSDLSWLRDMSSSGDMDPGPLFKMVELEMIRIELSKFKLFERYKHKLHELFERYQHKIHKKRSRLLSRSKVARAESASQEAERWVEDADSVKSHNPLPEGEIRLADGSLAKRAIHSHKFCSTSPSDFHVWEDTWPAYVSSGDLSFEMLREPHRFVVGMPAKVSTTDARNAGALVMQDLWLLL